RARRARGAGGGGASARTRRGFRHRAHLVAHARDPDGELGPRATRSFVATGASFLARERTPLRRAAGAEQRGDRQARESRAGPPVATQLSRAPTRIDVGRQTAPSARSALSTFADRAASRDGMSRRRGRPLLTVLVRRGGSGSPEQSPGADRRA